jgi:ribosomal protein S18 acetylase RimI-like enzyme
MAQITRPENKLFKIENATWRDLNALRNIETVCFPQDAWPLWDLIGVLTLPNVLRYKATVSGVMAGFIASDLKPGEQMAWIATVCVLPEYRRRGIGTALLDVVEKKLTVPRVRLNVRVSNHTAINLYRELQYHQVGIWPQYYQDGEDAFILEKELR